MDTWKNHQASAPRRGYSPHHQRPHEYPDWVPRVPRMPLDSRKDERDRFIAERRRSPPLEPQSYAWQSRQHEFSHRSRSPHYRERQPYLR